MEGTSRSPEWHSEAPWQTKCRTSASAELRADGYLLRGMDTWLPKGTHASDYPMLQFSLYGSGAGLIANSVYFLSVFTEHAVRVLCGSSFLPPSGPRPNS